MTAFGVAWRNVGLRNNFLFPVDFVLKDPREQEDEKKDETPDYKKE